MAIKQTNIFPIDKQPRNAVGLSYPFTAFSPSGSIPFKLNYTTKDQLRSNLTVFFTTSPNERPLNPDYGGGLYEFLFEPFTNDTFDLMERRIKEDLALYFPEVSLKSLDVSQDVDNNTVNIAISYTVFNNEEDTLEINFEI